MDKKNNILHLPSEEIRGKTVKEELHKWLSENSGLLEVLLDAYCVVDRENTVVGFNIAFTELCGLSHRRILKTGNFCKLLLTERCPDNCPALEILKSGKSIRIDELRGGTKGYHELEMILSGVPIFSKDGTLLGALITIRNVTAESSLQKKYYERTQASIHDGLTRIYNKVTTETFLHKMIQTALRHNEPLSIVMCDIDHFKKINDSYGHQAGDHVLVGVANKLVEVSRDSDLVGRVGGEEFLICLGRSPKEGAMVFSERLRETIAATEFIFEGKKIPVTISAGVATLEYSNNEVEKIVIDLIMEADMALYMAKKMGRNRCFHYVDIMKDEKKAS